MTCNEIYNHRVVLIFGKTLPFLDFTSYLVEFVFSSEKKAKEWIEKYKIDERPNSEITYIIVHEAKQNSFFLYCDMCEKETEHEEQASFFVCKKCKRIKPKRMLR